MSNTKLIIGAVLGLLGVWGLALFNAAKRLNFRPLIPQNVNVANGAFSFDMPLVVLNDSNRIIPVSGFAFDLLIQGKFLAKVYAFNVPPIRPGENQIYGRVVIPVFDLLNIVPELRTTTKNINVLFVGNVRLLEVLTIPVPDFQMFLTIPKINI